MNDSTAVLITRLLATCCALACAAMIVLLLLALLGLRPDSPVARLEILATTGLVASFWGYQGWRCAEAMNALKTTAFVLVPIAPVQLTRFPLVLVYGTVGLLAAFFYCSFNWVGAVLSLVWCFSVLSFVAIGSAALDIHEGREPFMVTARFAHGLGGVFGTILAHFTFRGHPVLDRLTKSVPTLMLAVAAWLLAPAFFALAVRNSAFAPTPEINRDVRPLSEEELLSPLDRFTSKGRPIGEPRGLTAQEYDSMTRSGWGGTLGPRHAVNRAMDRGY